MTPLETVARALSRFGFDRMPCDEDYVDSNWRIWEPQAKAALEALREPSEGMLMGGTAALDPIKGQTAFPTDEEATVVWQAMLTAALGEQP